MKGILVCLVLMLSACQSQPALTDEESIIINEDFHCQATGQPSEEAQLAGLTDCQWIAVEAEKIREKRQ